MIDLNETLRERGARWAEAQPAAPDLGTAIERIPRRNSHIRSYLAVAAAVLAVAVVSTIWLIRPSDHSPPGPVRASATSTPLKAVVNDAASRVAAIALQVAANEGDPAPTAMQAVRTTRSDTDRLEDSGSSLPDVPVWLVQVIGNFVCHDCKIPPGADPPSGTAITLVLDAVTYEGSEFGIDKKPLDLSKLGEVVDLSAAGAIPSLLSQKLRATKGLDHAEIVLTTWSRLHRIVHTDLRTTSVAIWFVQAHGSFRHFASGPIGSSHPATATSPTMQLVFYVTSHGAFVAKPQLIIEGHGSYDLSKLGTVLTLRP